MTILAAGTCSITASQGGDNVTWAAATPVIQSFTVNRASQTITFGVLPNRTYEVSFTLSATSTSGLPVSFASTTSGECAISGSQVMLVGIGTCSITASQAGDTNYLAAATVIRTFLVTPAPTTTEGSNASATYSPSAASAIFSVTVTSTAGTVTGGTITLSIPQVGVGTYTATVINGTANVTYAVPPATAPGVYNVQVAYGAGGNFAASGDDTHVLTVTPASGALHFVPVTPCRAVDTRNAVGPLGGPAVAAGSTRSFTIPGACGIPADAVALMLNVTVVPNGPLGYLTVWPAGQAQPYTSTLNSPDGRVKANAAIVQAGTAEAINVFATDTTQVIFDATGYYVPAGSPSGLALYPLAPCRVADTRNANGVLGGPYLSSGTERLLPVLLSTCGIPASAQAYSLNFTAVPHKTLLYLTVWPDGQTQPVASTLNAPTGAITANAAIIPAGTGGAIDAFASDDTDLVIDVNGYYAPAGTGGLSLYTMIPCRVLDTRNASGAFTGTLLVNVAGSSCSVPASAQAYVFNATVVVQAPLLYLTLWPDLQNQPLASTLNAEDKAITSNMAIVPTTNGFIDSFASNTTQLILDISSYYAP